MFQDTFLKLSVRVYIYKKISVMQMKFFALGYVFLSVCVSQMQVASEGINVLFKGEHALSQLKNIHSISALQKCVVDKLVYRRKTCCAGDRVMICVLTKSLSLGKITQ